MDTKRKVLTVLGTVAVIATAGSTAGVLFLGGDSPSFSQVQSSSNSPNASTDSTYNTSHTQSPYKDGTYSSFVSYTVPHDYSNSIKTSLTVANGVVTSVDVQNDASERESQAYVDWFEQSLSSQVVGKRLAGLSPSRIGGASLTTEAFDKTLDIIKNDATT